MTWILNKVVKTFQITILVVLAFLLTGTYIISALHMILLIFLTDFVTLSLSTDNVRYSEKPDSLNITGRINHVGVKQPVSRGQMPLLSKRTYS